MARYSEEDYIAKYGETDGKKRYLITLRSRETAKARKQANSTIQKSTYTEKDIENGIAIRCQECGKILTRLQWTHFKYGKCGVASVDEYLAKYPNAEILSTKLRILTAVTLDKMISLYGEELGRSHWKHYCDKQAETNTFEYKSRVYNWSRDEFDDYNQSRAVNIDNFINRYGEELGHIKWEEYRNRQRETCSLEYYIEKWGEIEGRKKHEDWMINWINAPGNIVSDIETKLWDKLDSKLGIINDRSITFKTYVENKRYVFDYGNLDKKKLIEFNGSYWHMDPTIYSENDVNSTILSTAKEIWDKDQRKISYANSIGYDVYVVWEKAYKRNRKETIQHIINWWNN